MTAVSIILVGVSDNSSLNSYVSCWQLQEVDSSVFTFDSAVPLLLQMNSSALGSVLNDVYISHD